MSFQGFSRYLEEIWENFFKLMTEFFFSQEDPETIALRLQSTRSLWDPSYIGFFFFQIFSFFGISFFGLSFFF